MSKLNQLKEQRAKVHATMKSVLETAENADRLFTEDEQKTFNDAKSEFVALSGRINNEIELIEMGREVASNFAKDITPKDQKQSNTMVALNSYLSHGKDPQSALTQGTDTEGGFLVPDEVMHNDIIKPIESATFVRGLATVHYLKGAKALGVVGLENDFADFEWTTELLTGGEDDLTFSKRSLSANAVAKRVKLSKTLVRNTNDGASKIVLERLANKLAKTEEKAFLLGSGTTEPLGLFVADANGVSTARDVVAENATTITIDDLIDLELSVPAAIRSNCGFILHTDVLKLVRKMKDSNGDNIYIRNLDKKSPDTLLGYPVYESAFAPNTIAINQYTVIFGDFSLYWIVDAMTYSVQYLGELYAETNQIGYIARMEADGHPILETGFARLKMAAA